MLKKVLKAKFQSLQFLRLKNYFNQISSYITHNKICKESELTVKNTIIDSSLNEIKILTNLVIELVKNNTELQKQTTELQKQNQDFQKQTQDAQKQNQDFQKQTTELQQQMIEVCQKIQPDGDIENINKVIKKQQNKS